MTKQSPSKRQLQTRQMFKDALYRLLHRDPYSSITVSSLCQEADLARRTFYRHYETLDDLLEDIIRDYVMEFLSWRDNRYLKEPSFRKLFELFFAFWSERSQLLLLFERQNLYSYLAHVFDEVLIESLSTDPSHSLDPIRQTSYIFISGGLWQLMHIWLVSTPHKSIEEMGDLAEQIQQLIASHNLPTQK